MKAELKNESVIEIEKQTKEWINWVCEETNTDKKEWQIEYDENEIRLYHPIYGWYIFPVQ